MSRDRGALALVLHSHMPYVEGFGTWPFGEEWLWEAVATVYLPLLDLLEGAGVAGHRGCHARAVRPARDAPRRAGRAPAGLPVGRPAARCTRRTRAAWRTTGPARAGGRGAPRRARLLARRAGAARRWRGTRWQRLAALGERPEVELITSSATHALLPLLASDAGLRLQLARGVASHERRFGSWRGGCGCPNAPTRPASSASSPTTACAASAWTRPRYTASAPPSSWSRWPPPRGLWRSRSTGRPCSWSGAAWTATRPTPSTATTTGARCTTCGPGATAASHTAPERAAALAREHARDFVERCIDRLDRHAADRGRAGLLTFALDTELLGHWWYEGQTLAAGGV